MSEKLSVFNELSILGINVKSGSRAEKLLSLYKKVDKQINQHFETTGTKPICGAGCGECCHEHFPITDMEFDLILCELQKWNEKDLNELINRFQTEWKIVIENDEEFVEKVYESSGFDSYMVYLDNHLKGSNYTCVFLDRTENKCMIYDVRPWICRTYGTSYKNLTAPNNTPLIKKIVPFFVNNLLIYNSS